MPASADEAVHGDGRWAVGIVCCDRTVSMSIDVEYCYVNTISGAAYQLYLDAH